MVCILEYLNPKGKAKVCSFLPGAGCNSSSQVCAGLHAAWGSSKGNVAIGLGFGVTR